jgi:hypothetical protein
MPDSRKDKQKTSESDLKPSSLHKRKYRDRKKAEKAAREEEAVKTAAAQGEQEREALRAAAKVRKNEKDRLRMQKQREEQALRDERLAQTPQGKAAVEAAKKAERARSRESKSFHRALRKAEGNPEYVPIAQRSQEDQQQLRKYLVPKNKAYREAQNAKKGQDDMNPVTSAMEAASLYPPYSAGPSNLQRSDSPYGRSSQNLTTGFEGQDYGQTDPYSGYRSIAPAPNRSQQYYLTEESAAYVDPRYLRMADSSNNNNTY